MATAYNRLKRKTSRWQNLPVPGQENPEDDPVDTTRYSLLLFLRDLEAGEGRLKEFVEGLEDAPGVLDEKSTMAAVLAAALQLKSMDHDYVDSKGRTSAKRRRIDLYGNDAAADQIAEYNELVNLARTVWSDPNDLRDILGELYGLNLRKLTEGGRYSIPDIFEWARAWAEVRYRFLNHSLRDDPNLWVNFNAGPYLTKGNAANAAVHESNVVLDSQMVEFKNVRGTGYTDRDRDIFNQLYILTPEEGRKLLQYSGTSTGLRPGLPAVFDYIIDFINGFINWRVRVLESARRQILADQAYKNARQPNAKNAVRARLNQPIIQNLRSIDGTYTNDFIPTVRKLLKEAEEHNAFLANTYNIFTNICNRFIPAVRNHAMNTYTNDLRYNTQFQRSLATFPGPRTLKRPTGTAMILAPRRT
ncbi:hypothetical protein GGR51DRAFT_213013 [Nemania sp. FL0031]|nr:hypothetical protein GGR51DRAFT_213013 [Nemania sp. FL0031]